MKKKGVCPNCRSTDIAGQVQVQPTSQSRHLYLTTKLHPERSFFQGIRHFRMKAWVCMDCGYVELYCDKPEKFAEAISSMKKNQE